MTVLILATPFVALAGMLTMPRRTDVPQPRRRHAAPAASSASCVPIVLTRRADRTSQAAASSPLRSIAPMAIVVSVALLVGSAVIRSAA